MTIDITNMASDRIERMIEWHNANAEEANSKQQGHPGG